MVLPTVVKPVVDSLGTAIIPSDTVIDELKAIASEQDIESGDVSIAMAIYLLGFGSYNGF